MKRLIYWVAKMYPQAWRERYGEEFEALLDDAGTGMGIACNVLMGAVMMQFHRWKALGLAVLLGSVALFLAWWWGGQRQFITPGTHQVFREDSNVGAMVGFLVSIAGGIAGLVALLHINDRNFRQAARAGWICAAILVPYTAVVVLVSFLTPRTIVSVSDSYCWDLWCMGIPNVNVVPQGGNTLYTADVRIFCDSTHPHRAPADAAKNFFYVLDERGRRFPLLRDASFGDADIVVNPGQTVASSLSFRAPSDARQLYLMGNDDGGLPWVYLYFGSDISLFHRRPLLRVI